MTWAEVSRLPLCLLTPDMQNRRIIDQHLAEAGVEVRPTLESNSMIVLFSHIRTGKWSSIMPLNLAETFGFAEPIRAIPIVEPDASHTVGLVAATARTAYAAGRGAARGGDGAGGTFPAKHD